MLCFIGKPAGTLVITRRLYKIASLRAIEAPSAKEVRRVLLGTLLFANQGQRRIDLGIDLFLMVGLPALVSGVFCT
jgi:hypothetical protein